MISTRKNIIATAREESDAISDNTSSNAKILRDAGARILHGSMLKNYLHFYVTQPSMPSFSNYNK